MKKVSPLAVSNSPLTVACYAGQRIGLLITLLFTATLLLAQDNCPNAGIFLDIPDICEGEELSLEVIRMTIMDSLDNGETDFGVNFVSFPGTTIPADPYIGGNIIANVPNEDLTGGADVFYGASTTGGEDLIPNTYIICTTLDPVPSNPACRPTNCQEVTILAGPIVTFVAPADICEDGQAVVLDTGEPSGGTYSGNGVQGDGRGGFEFNPVLSGVGTHIINYTLGNRDGCSTTVMDSIEVFENPITTISDSEDRCTGGEDAVFVGGPGFTGTFDSDAITGFMDNSDGTATLDVSAAGAGTYTVNYNYTDANGCFATAFTEISICESPCPTINLFADIPTLCEFEEINLIIDRITLIDSLDNQETDYGILFTSFPGSTLPADPYSGGDSLTFLERGDIMGGTDGFYNLNTTVTNTFTAGSYSICATLNPLPGDPACRPFLCQQISILSAPAVTFTGPADLCDDDLPVALNTGSPTGGNYSGPGVQSDGAGGFEFSPVLAGGGIHIISYEISNRDGCSNTATDAVIVFPLPMLSITLPATICENIPAFSLNESPTGGTLSGNGIVGNNFDPAVAGVGVHTITYDFTDANNCSNTVSETIEVFAAPIINFSTLSDLCVDAGVQTNISGGTPSGGTYGGPGVINNPDGTYSFDPATAGAGIHLIEYTFTDGNGCEAVSSDEVEIFPLPDVTFMAPIDLCVDAGVQSALSGGTPAEGIYSGPGVVNNSDGTYSFDPATAGIGTHSINYTYSTPDSIEVFDNIGFDAVTTFVISDVTSTVIAADDFVLASDQEIITVAWTGAYANPPATDDFTIVIYSDGIGMPGIILNTISIGDNVNRTDIGVNILGSDVFSYEAMIPSFNATAGTTYWISIYNNTPSGATWTWSRKVGGGNSIASFDQGNTWTLALGGEFDFRLAASAVSCTNTATDMVEVFATPMVSFTALADLCIDAGVQMNVSGGSPLGGSFTGSGVTDNGDGTYNFDPSLAGAGAHTITYSFTDGNGCDETAMDMVEVFATPMVSFTALADLCIDAGVQMNVSGGSPLGGSFTGSGVIDNGDGTYNFDPSLAGAGTHTITYSFTDGNGCDETAMDMVEVFATPMVSFTALADLCIDAGVQMNVSGGSPLGGSFTGSGVTDNGDGTYNFDPSLAGAGTHTITYSFTDGNGCDETAMDMVEVFNLPMVAETHQDVSECIGETNGSIDLTVTDNGIFNFNWVTVDGSGLITDSEDQNNLSAGEYMVTVMNATTSCSTTLTIEIMEGIDVVAPVMNCPSDITINCVDDQSISSLGMATATDNCDPSPMISFVDDSDFTGCSGTGQIIRTWMATDNSNNMTICEQMISIVDNDAPVFDMLSTMEVVDCPQEIPAPVALTATDECTGPITLMPEITTIDQTCANEFTRIYTYNFVDDCDNATVFTQSYQVVTSPPVLLTSPPDYTVACELDIVLYPHLVSVSSSCDGPLQISSVLNGPFGAAGCSGSTYEAVYSWTDGCHTDSVVQIYTLENEGPEFVCPPSICVIDCLDDPNLMQNTFDEYADFATVSTSCSASTVTITNDFAENNFINNNCGTGSSIAYPGALEYQVVTFTATDGCNRSTTCTAIVVVVDNTAPEFNGTPVTGFADCGSDVQATYDNWVNHQITRLDANDACGFDGAVELTYSPEAPTINNGSPSVTPVTFTASDACGNSSVITVSFIVESEGGPAFAQVPADEIISCNDLSAIFGNVILFENCSSAIITFEDVYVIGDVSSCDNQETAILRRTWTATDAAGNTATASQEITIIPGRANVAGTIFTEENELVSDIHLAVYLNNGMMDEQITTEQGTYNFELPVQNNYEILPTRNDHPLNGISTYDLVLLGQHLLEINTLDSPYQLIAADVNNSGSVSTLDMIALRRMILVIDTEFPNNESWRFIDADYLFPNSDNPFLTTFPESHNINGLSNDLTKDFVAIKTGDLNQSAVANALLEGDVREDRPLWLLEMPDELMYRGQEYLIPVTAHQDGVVNGFQYTLTFDPDLVEVSAVVAGALKGMNIESFGTQALDQGWLTTSWHQPYPETVLKGDTIFAIKFIPKKNIGLNKLFSINSFKTPAEMYTGSEILTPGLTFKVKGAYKVYQNVPNPFSTSTTIGFEQPASGTVKLTVFDVTGKRLYHTKATFGQGYQEFEIQKEDLNNTGVLFYKLDFEKYSSIKKMILID